MGSPVPIPAGTVVIEAESRFQAAAVAVSHLDLVTREHHVLRPGRAYRVDLCVTPRLPATVRFDRWAPNRYERLGRLFVVPPGEELLIWNDLGRETVIVCDLHLDAMREWFEEEIGPDVLDMSSDIANGSIEQLMLRLREEVRNPGIAAGIMVEGLALQLAVELRRHYHQALPPPRMGGLAPWRLRLIEERIRASDVPVRLSELATLCRLSVRQLSRGFFASRGVSLGHYVTQARITRAKQLLACDQSIKAVAIQLGFASTAAFCAAFRKATALTPSEYRRLASTRH